MKIVLTGGGSGGHFYPLIAVAREVQVLAKERKLLPPSFFYIGPTPYDERVLFETGIEFRQSPAGKLRRYFSLLNILDTVRTAFGIIKSIWQLFSIFPDVVFSKGGHASVPTLFAARLLGIPVVIHESDAKPGRANLWASRFARSVGISYPEAAPFFPKEKIALIGNPIRRDIAKVQTEGAHEFLKLELATPTILILGGSQGAERLNDVILEALPDLLKHYQIMHQTGERNFKMVDETARVVLRGSEVSSRYHAVPYLNELALRMSAGAAELVISRAGSGAIFEIAAWGKPSIVIPIPEDISNDQHTNAFSYARSGAAIVIEERNLAPHVLLSEIARILESETLKADMSKAATAFSRPDAARKIAEELLAVALEHEV